jgi:predicted Zn-dependent protease
MTHLAHKRFMEAINVFSELSAESPQDPQPVLWRALARARLKLKDNDESGAAEHYAQVLAIDENNHEARKFVREHGQKKRLEKLPFGRFFAKKK